LGAIDFTPRYPVFLPYQSDNIPFTGTDPVMGTYVILFTAARHVDAFAALVDPPGGLVPIALASRQQLVERLADLNESVARKGATIRYIVIDPVPDQMTTAYHIGKLIEYLQEQE
jgi:hypothetical protein